MLLFIFTSAFLNNTFNTTFSCVNFGNYSFHVNLYKKLVFLYSLFQPQECLPSSILPKMLYLIDIIMPVYILLLLTQVVNFDYTSFVFDNSRKTTELSRFALIGCDFNLDLVE